ncbi:MAG: hypothetical protein KC457_32440, partial [Myxococcales bacterium]|nr:hypothetical protein [Myxococcales bacterium]
GYEKLGEREILSVCHNPYPCEFDQGIVASMARRFEPRALLEHVGDDCRRRGAESCSYLVRWGGDGH